MSIFKFNPAAGRVLDEAALDAIQRAGDPVPNAPKENIFKRAFKQVGLAHMHMAHIVLDDRTITIKGHASNADQRDKMILAAGNIAGIETVRDHITVPEGTPDPNFVVVGKGETLETIAEKVPEDVTANDLLEANKPFITSKDDIYPGQTIRVPHQD